MHRVIARSFPFVLFLAPLTVGLTACGEKFSDEPYGPVDLAPFYADGATPGNIAAGVPKNIDPIVHFFRGQKADYYDFGFSKSIAALPDPTTVAIYNVPATVSLPKFAPVSPMYFFFDAAGKPMFSRPARENRNWTFHMRGGKEVLDPNPTANAPKKLAYPVRARALWKDPGRGNTADYQRPIVDDLPDSNRYSGLREIVKVKVKGGYEPDSIKSWKTLEAAIAAKEVEVQRTGKVINCPMVDERTYVTPSIMAHNVPHPRVEVWFRRKLGGCYLIDGWEALGRVDNKGNEDIEDDDYPLYTWGEDAQRLNVMDVSTIVTGEGNARVTDVVAPLGRVFMPRVVIETTGGVPLLFKTKAVADGALPRRNDADPPGYRPVRAVWGINIPQRDPPYPARTDNTLEDDRLLDAAQLSPSNEPNGGIHNFPLVGSAVRCGTDPVGMTPGMPTDPDPCAPLGLECPLRRGTPVQFCDAKKVGYGDYCSPGVAACAPALTPGDKAEAAFFSGQPGSITQSGTAKAYTCHGGPVPGTGHCYAQCDGNAPNLLFGQKVKLDISVQVEDPEKLMVPLDSRCGGEKMPGFQCLPISDRLKDSGGRMCLRLCDIRNPINFNEALCSYATRVSVSDAEEKKDLDLAAGTKCLTVSSITACVKDYAFEPAK